MPTNYSAWSAHELIEELQTRDMRDERIKASLTEVIEFADNHAGDVFEGEEWLSDLNAISAAIEAVRVHFDI